MFYKNLENTLRKTKNAEEWLEKIRKIKDYNTLDSKGFSPLGVSAYYGHLEACQFILEHGGKIDFKDRFSKSTPFFSAVSSFSSNPDPRVEQVIYFLMERGAKIDLANEKGQTPLMELLRYGHSPELALTLIEKEAKIDAKDEEGMTPLMYAANSIDFDACKILIEKGAKVNEKDQVGRNALYHLAEASLSSGYGKDILEKNQKNFEKIVDLLLKKGIQFDTQDLEKKDTLLILAASRGHEFLVKKCLEAGVNLNAQDENGDTALINACKNNSLKMISFLLQHGANTALKNKEGHVAPFYLSKNKQYSKKLALELLRKLGAPLKKNSELESENGDDKMHEVALMEAAEKGCLEDMEELVDLKVDLNFRDAYGRTALMLACKEARTEQIQLLVKAGADLNLQDKYGKTALMYLLGSKYIEFRMEAFEALMESESIDVKLKSNTGMNALMVIEKRGFMVNKEVFIERLVKKV